MNALDLMSNVNTRIAELLGYQFSDERGTWIGFRPDGTECRWGVLPSFASEWRDCGELLDWMREHGSSLILNWGEDCGGTWECSWITGGDRYTGVSNSPQMAACLAVLKAVDAKEGS